MVVLKNLEQVHALLYVEMIDSRLEAIWVVTEKQTNDDSAEAYYSKGLAW